MGQRFTIVIQPRGEGNLLVEDAMRQIGDAFELLSRTGAGHKVEWRLVEAHTNSPPLTIVAEAVDPVASDQVSEFSRAAREIKSGVLPEAWDDDDSREIAERLFVRLRRSTIEISPDLPAEEPILWQEEDAEGAIRAIETTPERASANTKSQMGSLEGELVAVVRYRGSPALRLRERKTGAEIVCELSPELAVEFQGHQFSEVWQNRRVTVQGLVKYHKRGTILRIKATSATVVEGRDMSPDELRDTQFTNGLSSVEYLRRLRDGDLG